MKVYILEDEIVQQFRLESLVKTYLKEKISNNRGHNL